MKKFLKERWHLHLLIGGLIGYILGLTFYGVPLLAQIFIVVFVSGMAGVIWEWGLAALGKAVVDYIDVLFGVLGALIGCFVL